MSRLGRGFLRLHSAELYFFLYNGSIVFILPYLAILWHSQGFTGAQIGLLSAVRPFICSISGQLLVGMADARGWHFGITLVTYVLTLAARSSMALLTGFIAHLLLILVSEANQSPFSIITDAAIAASTDEAGYTRKRVLASLGWGSLAPLSGWIVGKYGVPRSIAVYFGLVTLAFVPTLLLPLRELGQKRPLASQEADQAGQQCTSNNPCGKLAKCSLELLMKAGIDASHLDSRQHDGHAAELAIELTDAVLPAGLPGSLLVQRITSKASHAETPTLHPLLTTAEEDAAEAAVAGATAADAPLATPLASAADDSWSIPAVGSPLAAQRSLLPPLASPHELLVPTSTLQSPLPTSTPESFGLVALPGGTPADAASHQPSALARTTSTASTAFYSVHSGSSLSNAPGSGSVQPGGLWSPRGSAGPAAASKGRQPRSALLQQYMEGGGSALATPPATEAGAGSGAATPAEGQRQLQSQRSLQKEASNVSQALNGFDLSFLEGTVSDANYLTPRAASYLPAPAELDLPAVHTVHPPHFLSPQQQPSAGVQLSDGSLRLSDGTLSLSDGSTLTSDSSQQGAVRRRSSLLPPGGLETAKCPLAFEGVEAAAAVAGLGSLGAKEPLLLASHASLEGGMHDGTCRPCDIPSGSSLPGSVTQPGGSLRGGGGLPGSLAAPDPALLMWAGIRRLLSNPHHAAFFANTMLMGIGYGCLGYEMLYLKESGAPGILLGTAILMTTCGEMPVFFTAAWWLPRLGHTLAFNVAMVGWIVRLGLYTLLPLFPSLWCVLPVELLQGLTFAMAYGTGTVHVKAIAPPHLRSTTQSIFFSLYYGLGPGISGLAGGYIYQDLGMRWVFILGSLTLLVGWAAIQLALLWATRRECRAAANGTATPPAGVV